MTHGQGPGPDEAPAPPARTRWSEDPTPDADEIAPPYLPGVARRGDRHAEAPPAGASGPAPEAEEGEEGAGTAYGFEAEPGPVEPVAEPGPDGWESSSTGAVAEAGPIAEPGAEPEMPTYGLEPALEGPTEGPTGQGSDAAASDPLEEAVFELERMARLLREGGADAVAAEVSSPDRLTATLAGLLAGFLAGRR